MEIINKIKDFFEKVKDFSLLRTLLDRKIRTFISTIKLKKELIEFYKGEIAEADQISKESYKEIQSLESTIEELKKQMDDTIRVRCP